MNKILKDAAVSFMFEMAIEELYPKIVESMQEYLKPYTTDVITSMVKTGSIPQLPTELFYKAKPYLSHLDKISEVRLMEVIMDARPDLGQAIVDLGYIGAEYIVKLRRHLIELVRNPEKAATITSKDLVTATCDSCGRSWPLARASISSVTICPFCGN